MASLDLESPRFKRGFSEEFSKLAQRVNLQALGQVALQDPSFLLTPEGIKSLGLGASQIAGRMFGPQPPWRYISYNPPKVLSGFEY
jgi:hypothetical protein